MDLWIRSQSKGVLVKINDLRIMQLDKDDFRVLIEEDARDGWSIIANDDPCIGTYKTKERALEILDEISDELISTNYMPLEENEKITCGSARIYEMPKE